MSQFNYCPSADDIHEAGNKAPMNDSLEDSIHEDAGNNAPMNDSLDDTKALMKAAVAGDLDSLKDIVQSLTKGSGDPSAIFSFNIDGVSVLHAAAMFAQLEVSKYLVEELKGDVNAPGYGAGADGMTPFIVSARSGDVATVKYFLDRGGDLMKADDKGRTVLHHAAAKGHCMVTKFLLSEGVPVDINYGRGTPLFVAAESGEDKTLEILLDHGADPNTNAHCLGSPFFMALTKHSFKCMETLVKAGADVNWKTFGLTPLGFATARGGYTNFIRFLLDVGADANISDDLGWLPVQLAAARDCNEEVEMLFPLTSPIPNVPNWTIEGVISHAKIEAKKPLDQKACQRRKSFLKLEADIAFKQKDYKLASELYDMAISHGESAALYANRSLTKLLMGDGEGALSDALWCRVLRPHWAKAFYREGAALMLLEEYEQAYDALLDAQNLDPESAEIERELRKARELMKNIPGEREHV
ncbi:hypothetical protein CFC21_040396 [Triticum aestivum]|uniref:Uncharacterized protein n=3 Tax=Triticum TaxID=4564 RepID=A0A9R1FIE9_WHEAT|nr:ankyrin-1-like [Triticum dicoccoides]XP_044344357.1 ankyrin-1-like isoform X1 [Triticum aestivum]KAF7028472.1 hypothetical protein CFC21_040393 [Triticum aestivum]KAF7028479.1 hypothetical protein CFC21_040396 [Triticum aestivum]VAH74029.1 unnamed protein product [Triticum turgidum subsp. durum]